MVHLSPLEVITQAINVRANEIPYFTWDKVNQENVVWNIKPKPRVGKYRGVDFEGTKFDYSEHFNNYRFTIVCAESANCTANAVKNGVLLSTKVKLQGISYTDLICNMPYDIEEIINGDYIVVDNKKTKPE